MLESAPDHAGRQTEPSQRPLAVAKPHPRRSGRHRTLSAPGNPESPGARATRKWRARKAAGVRLVHVDLAEVEIDDLTKLGLIDPAKRIDNRELNRAVLAMVEDGIERRLPGTYSSRRNTPASQRLAAEARGR